MSSFGKASQPLCTEFLWASSWYFSNFSKIGTRFPDFPYSRPKNTFLGLEYEKSGNLVPNFEKKKNIIKMLTQILCRMAVTLFQTSSWGSGLKQNRLGRKFKNSVNLQSSFKSGSDLLCRKQLKMVLFENGPSTYYISIPVTVMVLLSIILTSWSLSWVF